MAFSGVATYDDFAVLDADISEILLLLSPRETPFLSRLPAAAQPAINVKHDWIQQSLGPDRIVASSAVNSATAATGITIGFNDGTSGGPGNLLQVGMLLELESSVGDSEIMQISSIAGANSILVNRNVGVVARGVNSLTAGGTIFVIGTAELEGDDTDGDVSRPRTTSSNYTQIFKKPVKMSGSRQSVIGLPNITNEMDHQVMLRTIELMRDLEKAVIRSVAVGSIGADDVYRSMNGVRAQITAINSTVVAASFAADPLLYLNNLMQSAWNAGARDLNVLLCGSQWGKDISATNTSKLAIGQSERDVVRQIETISTDFGVMEKIISPWMPPSAMLGVATGRIFVPNLRGRNFHTEELGKTGDSTKKQIIGEYTCEVHHSELMFAARIT
jgi:hypothetical protein